MNYQHLLRGADKPFQANGPRVLDAGGRTFFICKGPDRNDTSSIFYKAACSRATALTELLNEQWDVKKKKFSENEGRCPECNTFPDDMGFCNCLV